MTLYTIGRSTKNTVKIVVEGNQYRCTLTEDGGQYNRLCPHVMAIVEYLGQMWGYGALTDMGYDEMRDKVCAKLKLKMGQCLFV